ncbi:hypothetical protein ACP4OV_019271 [Aristida adscensionis]
MAAAIRFLRRRPAPAASPSLALMQPLLPAPYSKPPAPLMAAAATIARFFPGVGPVQSSPYSLLSNYSSKFGHLLCSVLLMYCPALKTASLISPGRPYHCCRPAQRVLRAALKASNGTHDGPSILKQGDERCRNTIRYTETEVMIWFRDGVLKDMDKVKKMMEEALKKLREAGDLLDAGWEDKAFSMYEKSTDDALKAAALREKALDDFAKGFGSIKGMSLDILEPHQMCCKELENALKSSRNEGAVLLYSDPEEVNQVAFLC